jgi:hypothetical protein
MREITGESTKAIGESTKATGESTKEGKILAARLSCQNYSLTKYG